MHAKQLGNLGEQTVATELIRKGYYVFKELGDICKSDLIVMDEQYYPIKVQVKCFASKNGAVQVKSSKSGPNYSFKYETKHADIYAIYVYDINKIIYVSNTELLKNKELTFRVTFPKNNQTKGVRRIEDYSEFERALRDCTRSSLTGNAEAGGTVQTTTETSGSGN